MKTTISAICIKLSAKAGNLVTATRLALIAESKACSGGAEYATHTLYEVYLDNVYSLLKEHMSRHQMAGCLSVLTEQGLYQPLDSDFGLYRMNKPTMEAL